MGLPPKLPRGQADKNEPDWQELVSELPETLHSWPWIDTLRTLAVRFREDRLGITAGSLTFTTVISLVPMLTVMLAVFSAFPVFNQFQGSVQRYLLQSLIPDSIAKPVLDALTQFAAQSNRLGSAGLVVLVVTAVAMMLTIDRALNNIWRVRRPRPIAQRVLVYWAAITLGPVLLGASLSLTSYAFTQSEGMVDSLPGGVNFLLNLAEFLLLAAGVAGLFHYVPNTEVRWRHALVGGIFVAAGFEIAKRSLTLYLASIPTYSLLYGAFATLPIFLIWLYLGWVIVLLGAVIAAYAPSLQMRVVGLGDNPGRRFELVVTLLRQLDQARVAGHGGLGLFELCTRLRIDPLQVEPMLEQLAGIDWIGRLDEEHGSRYVLLCDPATTLAAPLFTRFLVEPTPTLGGFWRRADLDRISLAELITPV
ncbi:YihY family inner membrane protein [Piscinibacter sakaiensis]|uniref:YihY family inner membrane protein n=1 Tax=Piscinibacter sakaiensis TaxID=1547922 RepID=UPI003AAEB5C9